MINSLRTSNRLTGKALISTLLIVRKARTIIGIPVALLFIIAVRLITPAIRIRFGVLISQRIGHLAANTEIYLCERDAQMHGKRTLDLFCRTDTVSNHQLMKMWDRTLFTSQVIAPLTRVNPWIPGWRANTIPVGNGRDTLGLLDMTPPHLSFTDQEDAEGSAALQEIGLPKGAPFVAFHSRDSEYLKQTLPNTDWSYHDIRDSAISNYIPAMEYLTQQGYYCVRMGAVVQQAMETGNPKIIDYARQHRTDFLDIYLSAKCSFFLGTQSGIEQVSNMVFRRPIAYVNWLTLEVVNSWSNGDLAIFKHIVRNKDGSEMTFHEILESGISRFESKFQFEQKGVHAVENTPDEILDVVRERQQRLNGTWEPEIDDDDLQEQFWSLIRTSELQGVIRSRIGAKFLRENRHLLG